MNILEILQQWGIPAITGVVAWNKDRILTALNVKKQETDIAGSEADNMSKNLKIYQDMIDDMKVRFESQLQDIEADYKEELQKHKEFIQKCNRSLQYYQKNCKCLPNESI
ncbi:hypothetical protein [Galbibacter pacificus]|uniref:Uncharacterized protein n=1 Tax=Galbibacter pacificus TaxID=2996052 RepID=A0ABT6FQC3_9FLAO|nr:hypothetical protein [Galbibacter pacificus]MDG3582059.1 hypothetical protein [Galbibacter pacificus]MDG3585467.1 hypothetical protein [Galbibacter pacificus]